MKIQVLETMLARMSARIEEIRQVNDDTLIIMTKPKVESKDGLINPNQPSKLEPNTEPVLQAMERLKRLDEKAKQRKVRRKQLRVARYNQRCSLVAEAWSVAETKYPQCSAFTTKTIADMLGYSSANCINGYVGLLVKRGILVQAGHRGSVRTYARKNKQ